MKYIPSEKQKLLTEEGILSSWRYRFLLHKRFFGQGSALLSEWKIQYLILGGILVDPQWGWLSIVGFGVLSYCIGKLWYRRIRGVSLTEIESEVGNQFNKFQQEMRQTYKKQ